MGFGMQPLTLELIDEGDFKDQLDERIDEAQTALLDHLSKYEDAAHKASVVVTAKIKLTITNPKEGTVAISANADVTRPKRPGSVTTAIQSTDQNNKPAFFVKAGGTDSGNPRQTKFATRDGELVGQFDGKTAAAGEKDDEEYEDVE